MDGLKQKNPEKGSRGSGSLCDYQINFTLPVAVIGEVLLLCTRI
jgi:hypothetical protein